jgi:hypothetical protein
MEEEEEDEEDEESEEDKERDGDDEEEGDDAFGTIHDPNGLMGENDEAEMADGEDRPVVAEVLQHEEKVRKEEARSDRRAKVTGRKVVDLVANRDVYHARVNGQVQLSMQASLLAAELMTGGGVSEEKLPFVLTTVLTLFFGEIDLASSQALIKASRTYKKAAERVTEIRSSRDARDFVPPLDLSATPHLSPSRPTVLSACLIADQSVKGHSFNAKMTTCLTSDGKLQTRSLRLDEAISKSAEGSAHKTFTSMVNQLGEAGVALFTSATSDGAASATNEAALVMKDCDRSAVALAAAGTNLTTPSAVIEGQSYDRGVAFREGRTQECHPHNAQTFLGIFHKSIFGMGGLLNESHLAQCLSSCHYWHSFFLSII